MNNYSIQFIGGLWYVMNDSLPENEFTFQERVIGYFNSKEEAEDYIGWDEEYVSFEWDEE